MPALTHNTLTIRKMQSSLSDKTRVPNCHGTEHGTVSPPNGSHSYLLSSAIFVIFHIEPQLPTTPPKRHLISRFLFKSTSSIACMLHHFLQIHRTHRCSNASIDIRQLDWFLCQRPRVSSVQEKKTCRDEISSSPRIVRYIPKSTISTPSFLSLAQTSPATISFLLPPAKPSFVKTPLALQHAFPQPNPIITASLSLSITSQMTTISS